MTVASKNLDSSVDTGFWYQCFKNQDYLKNFNAALNFKQKRSKILKSKGEMKQI